jgi:hypothetical protein
MSNNSPAHTKFTGVTACRTLKGSRQSACPDRAHIHNLVREPDREDGGARASCMPWFRWAEPHSPFSASSGRSKGAQWAKVSPHSNNAGQTASLAEDERL